MRTAQLGKAQAIEGLVIQVSRASARELRIRPHDRMKSMKGKDG
jgi:hypothetical protein